MRNKKFANKNFKALVTRYWSLFLICAVLILLIIAVLVKIRIESSAPKYFIYPVF